MRKNSIILQIVCVVFLLQVNIACRENSKDIHRNTNVTSGRDNSNLPKIPLIITKQSEQMNYLADHYWDGFSFSDTVSAETPTVENHFVEYLNILAQVPPNISKDAISRLMKNCDQNAKVSMRFFSLSEKYLYDPNSSLRNEPLYIEVLKCVLTNKKLPDIYKIRPSHQYKLACRNTPGSKAASFEFRTAAGKKGLLYKIKSPYLLIYFNNPGCGDCKRVCGLLKRSTVINSSINSGKLKILSVFPDEDLTEWKKENSSIPSSWINAFNPDATVKNNNIYDLKAIPSLYLLDQYKNVILKDALFEDVEKFIVTNAESK
ncbi:MAG: hypothetical protein H6Q12_381 [Bacteroidetes bacterium]|nr:hypothetical protein [Bacteroidota bacterium]